MQFDERQRGKSERQEAGQRAGVEGKSRATESRVAKSDNGEVMAVAATVRDSGTSRTTLTIP